MNSCSQTWIPPGEELLHNPFPQKETEAVLQQGSMFSYHLDLA